MHIIIDNIKLYYTYHNADTTDTTVILHGWGANSQTMQGVFNNLVANNKSVISLDLPFFGQSDPPPTSWGVYDYADIVEKFITKLGLKKINLLCHSFGARIAIILTSNLNIKNSINKLLFTGGAGLKPKRNLKYYIKVWLYKIKKRFGIKFKNAGSSDYSVLPDFMKPVFVRIVNTYLDKLLPKITATTLLIWGENDTATPLFMAKKMEYKIKNSALVIMQNAGHYAFLDNPQHFYNIMNAFLL